MTAPAGTLSTAIGTRAVRVLLAEDNPVNQQVAVHMLEHRGHRVTAVGDGRAAVEALEREPYDLVLMDVEMPEMDGLAATRWIRGEMALDLPVIALTAHSGEQEKEACRLAGMDAVLSKPIKADQLFEVVERHTGGPAADETSVPDGVPAAAEAVDLAGAADTVPVDLERLAAELEEAGIAPMKDLILQTFVSDAPAKMREIQRAAGDLDQLRKAAHGYKSAAGTVRAGVLADVLHRLEVAAAEHRTEEAAQLLGEVESLHEQVMAFLKQAA